MEEGIIYILTNDAMPDYIKIGMTQTAVEQRMAELDKTSIPLPFRCHYAVHVVNVREAEKLIHDIFGDYRTRPNREFFTVSPERVVSALKLAGGKVIKSIEGLTVDETGKEAAIESQAKQRRGNTSFYNIGIKDGDELTFTRDENVKCAVSGERTVEYCGTQWSLSGLAHRLMQKSPNQAINGFMFFEYNGEILWDRRNRLENPNDQGAND